MSTAGWGDKLDFRSDFLSRPTPEMLAAMAEASIEACGFWSGEHPRERALEASAAAVLGFEDALFCVTCSQATQIAIHLHCRPGDEVLTEASAHIITSEAGAAAVMSGVMVRGVTGARGVLTSDALAQAFSPGTVQAPRTALVLIENTHVRHGGTVTPVDSLRMIGAMAHERGAALHLDGSRLFNAAAYLGVPVSELGVAADSVSVSLNKGLAAPQGAILAGGARFIDQARRVRQIMGGGWRPAPALCAAGLVALETMPQRLLADHANAARLAGHLRAAQGLSVETPQTNLVLAGLTDPALDMADLTTALAARGVLVLPFGARRIRLAVYHDLGAAQIDHAAEVILSVLESARKGTP